MFVVLRVALTNLLLSSDNVLMIALMSHGLNERRRRSALLWSLVASVLLQLGILILMALLFRFWPLKVAFGVIICVMGFHLIHTHRPHEEAAAASGVPQTVFRITVGNLMMSFENEVALITLAAGNAWLAWVGVLITAPVVFFGSHMMVTLLRRYPLIVYAGAVYLFHVGAGLAVTSGPWLHGHGAGWTWACTALFAAYVAAAYLRRARTASVARGAGR